MSVSSNYETIIKTCKTCKDKRDAEMGVIRAQKNLNDVLAFFAM